MSSSIDNEIDRLRDEISFAESCKSLGGVLFIVVFLWGGFTNTRDNPSVYFFVAAILIAIVSAAIIPLYCDNKQRKIDMLNAIKDDK